MKSISYRWLKKVMISLMTFSSVNCVLAKRQESIIVDPAYDDWQSISACKVRRHPDCHSRCDGYYVEPEFSDNVPANPPTIVESDEGSFVSEGRSVFTGNVKVTEGNKMLWSDKAYVIRNQSGDLEYIEAEGRVKIVEPGLRVDGTKAKVLIPEDKKFVINPNYRIYDAHGRGTGTTFTIFGKKKMEIPKGTYTTCAPGDNVWELKTKKTKFDKDTGRGEAWHAKLYVKDIPVFYWPYVNFPIDNRRQTGFLQPTYSHNSSFGLAVAVPYYFNLAPNADYTITPYATYKRGTRFLNELRYLSDRSAGMIKFDFLPRDKEYIQDRKKIFEKGVGLSAARLSALKDISMRSAYSIKHKTQVDQHLDFEVNFARSDDDNFIEDIGGEIIEDHKTGLLPSISQNSLLKYGNSAVSFNRQNLLQELLVRYNGQFGQVQYHLQQFQALYPKSGAQGAEQYRKLPEITFQSTTYDILSFDALMQAHYTNFKFKNDAHTYGERYHIRPTISYPMVDAGWFIKPTYQLDVTHYRLQRVSAAEVIKPEAPKRTVPLYSLDTGLIFERTLNIQHTSYVQTLEPRAYFLYVPNRDQRNIPNFEAGALELDYSHLFRDNRYSGIDKIGEAKQLSIGVSSNFLTEATGEQKASVGVGRIYYFQDRINHINPVAAKETLRQSPFIGYGRYHIDPRWSVIAQFVWDQHYRRFHKGSYTVQYKPTDVSVFNLGYQFQRDSGVDQTKVGSPLTDTRQLHMSSMIEVSRHLRLLGKLEYDLSRKQYINVLAGIEYLGCCTNFRLVGLRNRVSVGNLNESKKYESAIAFQVVLKGFAGTGSANPDIFAEHVPGYHTPRDNEF